jgi:predicted secreted hydrolase
MNGKPRQGITGRRRRRILVALAVLAAQPRALAQLASDAADTARFPRVVPGYRLRFPQDFGSHPAFRTEWWYITGWLNSRSASEFGFQITFFRTRIARESANPSAFTPRELLIAHAALTDPRTAHTRHGERIAREGFALAAAATGRMHVWIDDWSLEQRDDGIHAAIAAGDFGMRFLLAPTQSPLLNGDAGYSRKGPEADAASYYYSLPQLAVTGAVSRNTDSEAVSGRAWLDHEWSSSYLPRGVVGWDWIGINGDDGSALMAFRMRDRDGNTKWAGATQRSATGATSTYRPEEITFTPRRTWRSPKSGAVYPVALAIKVGAIEIAVEPLIDDQEYDARASTGTIYWEGAVRADRQGAPYGKGYLELTGYWGAMRM